MKSRLASFLSVVFITFLLLEAGTCLLMKMDVLQGDIPTYSLDNIGSRFWKDIHPAFGVWHVPNTSFQHRKSCFDVEYRTNSEGMRDRPREKNGPASRVLTLGDSFIEGWGVPEQDRLSNLLEREKGREFLNFGTSGYFGTTQYFLLYDRLAKAFSHDSVLVGVLPSNDFNDDNYGLWKDKGRHRPFWVGDSPPYELRYARSVPEGMTFRRYLAGVLREFSYLYNAIKNVVLARRTGDSGQAGKVFSRFYDFNEGEYGRMEYSLTKLRESAEGKRVTVILIPILHDLERYDRDGKSPLTQRLEAWGKRHSAEVVDLTPWFHDYQKDWRQYYFPCDNHWSSYGNHVAFDLLIKYY